MSSIKLQITGLNKNYWKAISGVKKFYGANDVLRSSILVTGIVAEQDTSNQPTERWNKNLYNPSQALSVKTPLSIP